MFHSINNNNKCIIAYGIKGHRKKHWTQKNMKKLNKTILHNKKLYQYSCDGSVDCMRLVTMTTTSINSALSSICRKKMYRKYELSP